MAEVSAATVTECDNDVLTFDPEGLSDQEILAEFCSLGDSGMS